MYQANSPSRLTAEKIQLLNSIGFVWKVEKGNRKKLIPIPEADREVIVSIPKDSVITPVPEEEREQKQRSNPDVNGSKKRYKRNPRVLPQAEVIRLPRRIAETIKSRGRIQSEPLQCVKNRKAEGGLKSMIISNSSGQNNDRHDNDTNVATNTSAQQQGLRQALVSGLPPDVYANLAPQINGNDFPNILIATQNGLLPFDATSQLAGFNQSNNSGTAVGTFNNYQQQVSALSAIAAFAVQNGGANQMNTGHASMPSTFPNQMSTAANAPKSNNDNINNNDRKRKDPPSAGLGEGQNQPLQQFVQFHHQQQHQTSGSTQGIWGLQGAAQMNGDGQNPLGGSIETTRPQQHQHPQPQQQIFNFNNFLFQQSMHQVMAASMPLQGASNGNSAPPNAGIPQGVNPGGGPGVGGAPNN